MVADERSEQVAKLRPARVRPAPARRSGRRDSSRMSRSTNTKKPLPARRDRRDRLARDPGRAVAADGGRVPSGESGQVLGRDRAESLRLLEVAEPEQRHVARLDQRCADRLAPGLRADAERHRERHVRGLAARRVLAVVQVQVTVQVDDPEVADPVAEPGDRARRRACSIRRG